MSQDFQFTMFDLPFIWVDSLHVSRECLQSTNIRFILGSQVKGTMSIMLYSAMTNKTSSYLNNFSNGILSLQYLFQTWAFDNHPWNIKAPNHWEILKMLPQGTIPWCQHRSGRGSIAYHVPGLPEKIRSPKPMLFNNINFCLWWHFVEVHHTLFGKQ